VTPAGENGAPFRGPEPFRFMDADIFRARDADTRALLQTITIYRGVLIYGEQAAGKSSLVNAALIPGLRDRGYAVERLLFRPDGEHHLLLDRIPVADDGPPYVDSLFVGDDGPARVAFTVADFEARLRAALTSTPAGPTPVLILDQFEEIVTLAGPSGANAAADAVVSLLLHLFFDRTLPVKLVLVFREDYLAKISDRFSDAPDFIVQRYWLRPPPKSAAEEIITGPFDPQRARHPYSPGPFTPDLVTPLVAEFKAHGQSDRLSLTDLQIACLELWNVHAGALRLLGEVHVQGLIQRYFNRALDQLGGEGLREPAIALLTYMVTPYGTRNVISKDDVIGRVRESEDTPAELLERALAALVKTRLVRHDLQHHADYYDVVSEYLAPWIAQQRRVRDAQIANRRTRAQLRNTRYVTALVSGLVLMLSLAVGIYTVFRAQRNAVLRDLQQARAQIVSLEGTVAAAEAERNRAQQFASELAQAAAAPRQKGSTMFGSTILEVAIGLALLYTLLSLICTIVNELIAAVTNARSQQLAAGLQQLLGDEELVDRFYAHPLIRGLTVGGRRPAYVPSKTFAYALLDAVAPDRSESMEGIRSALLDVKSKDLKRALLLLQARGGHIEDFSRNVEQWFNDAMEAVAGAYKRRTQWQLLALAAVVTVALNVDTLNVMDRLLSDPANREALVARAQALAAQTATESSYQEVRAELGRLELPIGWAGSDSLFRNDFEWSRRIQAFAGRVLGWLITALAVSLGAPFWFDLLNKVMVVRSTVKPREKSRDERSKD
jgi:hypothetical protein